MEQTLKVQSRKLNGKVAIIILSIAAIVLRIFAYFQTVGSNFFDIMMLPILARSKFEMELLFEYFVKLFTSVHFPNYLLSFLTSLIIPTLFVIKDILPILLFVVYLAFFFKKSKATVLLPITFGVLALGQFISLINAIINLIRSIFIPGLNITITIVTVIIYMFPILSYVIIIVAAVLLLIGSLKGFVNKPLVVIPCTLVIAPNVIIGVIVGFLLTISGIIATIDNIMTNNFTMTISSFTILLSGISSVTLSLCTIVFFIAILVFVAKNYVPEIIPMSDAKLAALAVKKPKAALEILKMRYETGKLTEEEYTSRVSKIESKEPTL